MEPGDIVVTLGILIVAIGVLLKLGVPIGQLPGDVHIQGDSYHVYLPITTSILASILLAVVFYIIGKL